MAAEQTAAKVGTFTLTADTQAEINITPLPESVKTIEIVHHGNVTDVVYYKIGLTEASVAIAALHEDDAYPLVQWERKSVNIPERGEGADADTGIWVGLRAVGAARVSVIRRPAGG